MPKSTPRSRRSATPVDWTPHRLSSAAPHRASQRVLGSALHEGGWFDTAHEAAVKEAVGAE